MNIVHEEHGSVDGDALMAVHNEKVQKKMEMSAHPENCDDCESSVNKHLGVPADADSQECVGDARKKNTIKWANMRLAHKNNRGQNTRSKPTYAQVVAE